MNSIAYQTAGTSLPNLFASICIIARLLQPATMAPIRVGIVGLRPVPPGAATDTLPVGFWAVKTHLPALKALHEDYEIVAVCNSSVESATEASKCLSRS